MPSKQGSEVIHLFLKTYIQLNNELLEKEAIKWYIVINVDMSKHSRDGAVGNSAPYCRRKCEIDLLENSIQEHVNFAFNEIKEGRRTYTQNDLGGILEEIKNLNLKIETHKPLSPTSYLPLSKKRKESKEVLNIKNLDNVKYFIWCFNT